MHVFGTAGHVDHGKSTLISALTGTNPDRLREEQEREMTIELGFAWMRLPSGGELGFVDVPGHRDFIENMLAGVGGMDACLFIIAADEGIMPQTREHMAILNILGIQNVIVCMTKIDMVTDPEWLDLMEMEIRDFIADTPFADAPIMRISAREGIGISELISAMDRLAVELQPKADYARPRLPIDRVFSIAGFGTVVTGTLLDGTLQIGREIEIMPARRTGRIRGLQTHKKKEQAAQPGSRTAVNITGIDVDEINRGEVLTYPGTYTPVSRFDAVLRVLPDAARPLKQQEKVKLFTGTVEVLANCRLLEGDEVRAGTEAFVQIDCDEPLIVIEGDRFVIRRLSPAETLGGGVVLSTRFTKRRKKNDLPTIQELSRLLAGNEQEKILQAIGAKSVDASVIAARTRLSIDEVSTLIQVALDSGILLSHIEPDGVERYIGTKAIDKIISQSERILGNFHREYPLKPGMQPDALKAKLSVGDGEFRILQERALEQDQWKVNGRLLSLRDFAPALTKSQEENRVKLLSLFTKSPFTPPDFSEARELAGEDVIEFLVNAGTLKRISKDILFSKDVYEDVTEKLVSFLGESQKITVSQFREMFGMTRKYAVPLLEHFDTIKLTKREGDFRTLAH
ncbi:MAG TPA: selenocysteine-specific translation elongation factor [Bellilinea sp.]|nr:selenocysteine-specific translation elongation factor [Bellilinea sp.]